jgi:hypothetical protein
VIFRQLSDAGTKNAYVDLDQLALCYPALEDDPENNRIRAANLAGVWTTYRDEGVRCMVISGITETNEIVKAHTDLLPDAQVTMVRLRVAPDELRRRFVGRGWYARRADEIIRVADDMDRDDVGDVCVDTDGLTPMEIAGLVRATAGDWPGLP